jgi:hypothetical protein
MYLPSRRSQNNTPPRALVADGIPLIALAVDDAVAKYAWTPSMGAYVRAPSPSPATEMGPVKTAVIDDTCGIQISSAPESPS